MEGLRHVDDPGDGGDDGTPAGMGAAATLLLTGAAVAAAQYYMQGLHPTASRDQETTRCANAVPSSVCSAPG